MYIAASLVAMSRAIEKKSLLFLLRTGHPQDVESAEGQGQAASGTIRITRKSDRDIKIRDLFIQVEGEKEQNIKFGEVIEIPVPAGKVEMRATNRLYFRDASFEIGPDETVVFEVANVATKGPLSALMLITGTILYRVELKRL